MTVLLFLYRVKRIPRHGQGEPRARDGGKGCKLISAAAEADGALNIIATATFTDDSGAVQRGRGAVMFKVCLNEADK